MRENTYQLSNSNPADEDAFRAKYDPNYVFNGRAGKPDPDLDDPFLDKSPAVNSQQKEPCDARVL